MSKLLLSINYKLFFDNADDFVNKVKELDTKKLVGGFEVYFDNDNDFEKNYMLRLARLCHDNNYVLNIHSREYKSRDSYLKYLTYVNFLSDMYGKNINLTLHPAEHNDKNEAVYYSKNIFMDLVAYVKENGYRINLCIENLNTLHGVERLSISELWEIIRDIKDLKLTHDIGHEMIDQNDFSRLYDEMLSRLNNIHIHNFYDGKDHYPIRRSDYNIEMYYEIFRYIKEINYDRTIVLEYAPDYMDGNEDKERALKNYINFLYDFNDMYNEA